MDRLEAMSIVLAVAEAGSLSAAARRLNTPPATASRKITELEEHLRAKLFDRSTRNAARQPAHRAAARHHPHGRVREPRLSGGTRDAEDARRSRGARLHHL